MSRLTGVVAGALVGSLAGFGLCSYWYHRGAEAWEREREEVLARDSARVEQTRELQRRLAEIEGRRAALEAERRRADSLAEESERRLRRSQARLDSVLRIRPEVGEAVMSPGEPAVPVVRLTDFRRLEESCATFRLDCEDRVEREKGRTRAIEKERDAADSLRRVEQALRAIAEERAADLRRFIDTLEIRPPSRFSLLSAVLGGGIGTDMNGGIRLQVGVYLGPGVTVVRGIRDLLPAPLRAPQRLRGVEDLIASEGQLGDQGLDLLLWQRGPVQPAPEHAPGGAEPAGDLRPVDPAASEDDVVHPEQFVRVQPHLIRLLW